MRSRLGRYLLATVLASFAVAAMRPVWAQAQATLSLVSELQKGGYVVFFRHGATDQSQKDTDPNNLSNCATQRNLIEYGREQAQMIAAGIKSLQLPIGAVLSSGYCRCLETANLAFGHATPVPELASYLKSADAEKKQRVAFLATQLNIKPKVGTNTVLVGHHLMFEEATGLVLEEGEGAIYKPTPDGAQFIARIRAEGWQMVVDQFHAAVGQ